jgi:hypothetical protein
MRTRIYKEIGYLTIEHLLHRAMNKLGAVTIFFGEDCEFRDVKYRKSAYFLQDRNVAVGVSCSLNSLRPEYAIDFHGLDGEIDKLEQILEEEIGLNEIDRRAREEPIERPAAPSYGGYTGNFSFLDYT